MSEGSAKVGKWRIQKKQYDNGVLYWIVVPPKTERNFYHSGRNGGESRYLKREHAIAARDLLNKHVGVPND